MDRVWHWVRDVRHKTAMSATGAALAAGVTLFVLLAHVVDRGHTRALDNWILRLFRRPDDLSLLVGPEWFIRAVRDATSLGSVTILIPFALAVAGHFFIRGRSRDGGLVLAASLGALVANALLKLFFDRERPVNVPALVEVTSSSFPSGHAMLASSIYFTLGLLLARAAEHRVAASYYLVIATGLAVTVSLTRVILGVHYPSDVLAGSFAGLAWALGCRALAGWGQSKGIADVEPPKDDGKTEGTASAVPSK